LAKARLDLAVARVLSYSGQREAALAYVERALAGARDTFPGAIAEVCVWAGWFHCCQAETEPARRIVRLAR
jgi:hypothetical protein